MTISIKTIPIGSTITFRSKNAADTVVWKGTLDSYGGYHFARRYADPAPYNEAVRQTDATVSSDETTLSYFVIIVDNGQDVVSEQMFAEEWILSGSLAVITPANKVTIQVTDPANNPLAIVSLLASAGYNAVVLP